MSRRAILAALRRAMGAGGREERMRLAREAADEMVPIERLWNRENAMYGDVAKKHGNAWGDWEPLSEMDVRLAQLNPFGDKRVSLPGGATERTRRGDDARRIAYLAKHGFDYPLLATPDAEPVLIDGAHRLAAARLRGDTEVPVRWAKVEDGVLDEYKNVDDLHEEMQRLIARRRERGAR